MSYEVAVKGRGDRWTAVVRADFQRHYSGMVHPCDSREEAIETVRERLKKLDGEPRHLGDGPDDTLPTPTRENVEKNEYWWNDSVDVTLPELIPGETSLKRWSG